MSNQTNLERAVNHLRIKNIIKRDSDIAEALEMSKGTLSAYITGKTEPSKNFIEKFENHYGIRVVDFENTSGDLRDDYIALLKDQNNYLKKELGISLKEIKDIASINMALMKIVFQVLAENRSRLEKRPLKDVQLEMGKQYDEILQHILKMDK